MLDYNLTQRERQLLIQLLALSKHSKDYFEARTLDPYAIDGPKRELARLDFVGDGLFMDLTKRDLRTLKDEGLIHFLWDQLDLGRGRLSSLAFEAVHRKFNRPVMMQRSQKLQTSLPSSRMRKQSPCGLKKSHPISLAWPHS